MNLSPSVASFATGPTRTAAEVQELGVGVGGCDVVAGDGRGPGTGVAGTGVGEKVGVGVDRNVGVGGRTTSVDALRVSRVAAAVGLGGRPAGGTMPVGPDVVIGCGVPLLRSTTVAVRLNGGTTVTVRSKVGSSSAVSVIEGSGVPVGVGVAVSATVGVGVCSTTVGRLI